MLHQKYREDQAALKGQHESLRGLVAKKDKELMMIKAGEFDKVDVIKQLAEAEGKQNYLGQENERLKLRLQEAEERADHMESELERVGQLLRTRESETRELSRHHNSNLEQFDAKFDTLH